MIREYNSIIQIIKGSLWGTDVSNATQHDYEEMRLHAILSLPGNILNHIAMPKELRENWKTNVLQNVATYLKIKYTEQHLPLTVPYVILKGSSAAQYYPFPEFRTEGDIDLMTREEDYCSACDMFLQAGWKEVTEGDEIQRGRHRSFRSNGIIVELHFFFSSIHEPNKAKALDQLIRKYILPGYHRLPDMINGLVLMSHIYQHLKDGIGLRQVLDWMMFVYRCLPDEKWNEFEPLADQTGIKNLAISVTRMCELYLGLLPHAWSTEADESVCSELMDYIISSGNFGSKLQMKDQIALERIRRLKHPVKLIIVLLTQSPKKKKMKTKGSCGFFVFLNGVFDILSQVFNPSSSYAKDKKNKILLRKLGINGLDNALVYYEDGEYIRRNR